MTNYAWLGLQYTTMDSDQNFQRILFRNTFFAFFCVCEKFWMKTEKLKNTAHFSFLVTNKWVNLSN